MLACHANDSTNRCLPTVLLDLVNNRSPLRSSQCAFLRSPDSCDLIACTAPTTYPAAMSQNPWHRAVHSCSPPSLRVTRYCERFAGWPSEIVCLSPTANNRCTLAIEPELSRRESFPGQHCRVRADDDALRAQCHRVGDLGNGLFRPQQRRRTG